MAALTENGWHLVLIILLMLAASLTAFFINRRLPAHAGGPARPERWIIRPLVGLMAGWVSVASFANIAGAARISGAIQPDGAGETLAAVLILLAAGAGAGGAVGGAGLALVRGGGGLGAGGHPLRQHGGAGVRRGRRGRLVGAAGGGAGDGRQRARFARTGPQPAP
ncbi:hypothetical protein [Teichococcus aestuarii]|uniref:hypothetical protein n=1 Tax=Teichococcus aestuarii TaxID=568898 RepID=UPI00361A4CF1